MKKVSIFFVCILLFHLQTFSQVKINPQIGFNFASLQKLDNATASDVKAGFQAGVDVRVGSKVYFQPGLFFSKVNTTLNTDGDITVPDSLHYSLKFARSSVKVKALLGVNVFSVPTTTIRLNAGPTFDVIVAKNVEGESLAAQAGDQIKDQFKSSAFNLDFGAGVDLLKFTAEIGYSVSFSDAFKSSEGFEDSNASYGVYYLNVGIVF